jgi:hypothetical protein
MRAAISILLAAAGSASTLSELVMKSTLGSKIKMGGAVINSYCESDLQPGFSEAYVEAQKTMSGVENDVVVVLKNVKMTCAGNGGEAPCATGAGRDRHPSFVCKFTGADGTVEESAKVQGLRVGVFLVHLPATDRAHARWTTSKTVRSAAPRLS